MGYRLVVVLAALFFLASCSAFDDSNTPYDDDIVVPPGGNTSLGLLSGYYAGTMVLDTNTCESVSDSVGASVPTAIDVVQTDTAVSVTFEDGSAVSGTLEGDKVILMQQTMSVKHVYYFTLADDAVTGSCSVIEADSAGQFGDSCASYTVSLDKAEKPSGN